MLRAAALLLAAVSAASPAPAQERVGVRIETPRDLAKDHPPWPLSAELSGPVAGHPHDVLGGIPAFGVLSVTALACGACRNGYEGDEVALPPGLVFEDVAPRLWDVTGDGLPEIVVVEATADKGARLAVEVQVQHQTPRSDLWFGFAPLKTGRLDYLVQKEETPSAVLAGINAEFSKTIDTDHFVTAFYAVFDFASMTCTFCNAGHPPQLIARRDGGFTELSPSCPVIGLSERSAYSDQTAAFGYGDVLCFYTDGVIESRNASGDMFGVEGVKATIASSITEGVDGMADRLLTDLIGFLKDPCFEDDITILFGQVLDSL